MNSKSRIAVVVLATAIGWALQRFINLPNAVLFGFLVGLIAARFVPGASSCAIKPIRDGSEMRS